jgi:hypothetical protein
LGGPAARTAEAAAVAQFKRGDEQRRRLAVREESEPSGTVAMFDHRDHFAKADQHVSELKERIARERSVVERTKQRGHSTAASESILRALESSLRAFEKRRQVIFDRQEAKRGHAIANKEAPLTNAPVVKREAEDD